MDSWIWWSAGYVLLGIVTGSVCYVWDLGPERYLERAIALAIYWGMLWPIIWIVVAVYFAGKVTGKILLRMGHFLFNRIEALDKLINRI